MVNVETLACCGLLLLSLGLCVHSVPITADRTKENVPDETLEPPQSAVSQPQTVRANSGYCLTNRAVQTQTC